MTQMGIDGREHGVHPLNDLNGKFFGKYALLMGNDDDDDDQACVPLSKDAFFVSKHPNIPRDGMNIGDTQHVGSTTCFFHGKM